jgi:hypothetical protein
VIHAGAAAAWLLWLEQSAVAQAMRQWRWLYPIVEVVHIVGFVLLVGAAAMFDLRLLGLSRSLPVATMARHLLPWARVGLGVVAPTGLLMFTAHATEFATNPAFQLKLALITAACLNAAVFLALPHRERLGCGDRHPHGGASGSRKLAAAVGRHHFVRTASGLSLRSARPLGSSSHQDEGSQGLAWLRASSRHVRWTMQSSTRATASGMPITTPHTGQIGRPAAST